jgi:hypothetical protein
MINPTDQMDIVEQLRRHMIHERHHTHAETVYWCGQYRHIAALLVADLNILRTVVAELEAQLSTLRGEGEPVAFASAGFCLSWNPGYPVSELDLRETLPLYLHPSPPPQEEAIELLEYVFNLYEDGDHCYEDPDEQAGYLGKAIAIGGDEFDRIIAVLNATAPRRT